MASFKRWRVSPGRALWLLGKDTTNWPMPSAPACLLFDTFLWGLMSIWCLVVSHERVLSGQPPGIGWSYKSCASCSPMARTHLFPNSLLIQNNCSRIGPKIIPTSCGSGCVSRERFAVPPDFRLCPWLQGSFARYKFQPRPHTYTWHTNEPGAPLKHITEIPATWKKMFSLPFLHSNRKGRLPVSLQVQSSWLLLVKSRAAYKGFLGNSPARQPCIASSVFTLKGLKLRSWSTLSMTLQLMSGRAWLVLTLLMLKRSCPYRDQVHKGYMFSQGWFFVYFLWVKVGKWLCIS